MTGNDDHPLSRYTCPALTTVAQDYGALGNLCAEILLAKIGADPEWAERNPVPDQVKLEAKLMMRQSA